jgi:imidazolonepropionase-like amidohydrolase
MYDLIIKNARIFTAEDGNPPIENGCIAIHNGKIAAISGAAGSAISGETEHSGDDLSAGETLDNAENIIDAAGMFVYPGLIDAHSHIGLLGTGQGAEGDDLNEDSENAVPHIRTIDGIDTFDEAFTAARAAGITTVLTGSGSANPVGGDIIAVKTAAKSEINIADDMFIKVCGIKFALGENPKNRADTDSAPKTRMGTAAVIRETLFTAKHYLENKEAAKKDKTDPPDFDFKSEALIPLLTREISAHFHCHKACDIVTAMRIAKEFELDAVLVHASEGYKITDYLKEQKIILGPFFGTKDKPELAGSDDRNAAILEASGVQIAISSDYPEIPLKMLRMSAAEAVKNGMTKDSALAALTSEAAKIAGIYDRTGSIATGKDADLIITNGDLFDFSTEILTTIIEGKKVFERQ